MLSLKKHQIHSPLATMAPIHFVGNNVSTTLSATPRNSPTPPLEAPKSACKMALTVVGWVDECKAIMNEE